MRYNTCAACKLRFNFNDTKNIQKCCIETCSSYVGGTWQDVLNSPCGQQCQSCTDTRVTLSGPLRPKIFKKCFTLNGDRDAALECCLVNCSGNTECMENCIDSYNSVVPSAEMFSPNIRPCGFFLILVLLLNLVMYCVVSRLGLKPKTLWGTLTLIQLLLYKYTFY